ncbi:peptidase S41 [Pedobacter sp. BAL39]|uniref:S41 family peptidase n=1 Tax=Pedobacter sp. BAL39 TaxID=391596 RepID=UPI000155B24E|nr:S41 family peptidase [Pedobacter sp. BAL39]EDM34633.1 peptidase S41 [Pedobacter sp. BAL39]
MKFINLLLLLSTFLFSIPAIAQIQINGSFEELDKTGNPVGWDLSYYKENTYTIQLDSLIKAKGKYSVSISAGDKPIVGNAIVQSSTQKLNGKLLSLVGSIRTENVSDGWAGLWMRVDGEKDELASDLMESQGLKGSQDWKEYAIQIPYDQANAKSIHFGALLFGKGKIWVDGLRLYLDGTLIEKITPAPPELVRDTLYDESSRINTIPLSPEIIRRLSATGKIWAFLKYHHPMITAGKYNWDRQLFEHLPEIISTQNDSTFSNIIEKWVDQLGQINPLSFRKPSGKKKENIVLQPDYAGMFSDDLLSQSLRNKLQYILTNNDIKTSHYISLTPGVGNPLFENEKFYSASFYPDAGIRLLALYRYWAMVQYFNPNRAVTETDWNGILPLYIPEILKAKDKNEYHQVLARLICSIRDGHGFLSSSVYQSSSGKYRLPFDAKYIEDKLVVTEYLTDNQKIKKEIAPGDVIDKINGKPVAELIKTFSPYSPGSNISAIMRDMPGNYLLRSDRQEFSIEITREGTKQEKTIIGVESDKINFSAFYGKDSDQPFRLLDENIGYVQGNKLKKENMDSLKRLFAHTKGMIVDMRGYPIDDLNATISEYILDKPEPFVRFTIGSIANPGQFTLSPSITVGKKNKNAYKGKVIILVNEVTQSNAEFVTMAFQTSGRTKVIGSASAGADGNISRIVLPGGFSTYFSGIGVYYPDGTNAQQKGVKIDETVRPTIKGISEGVDELLERAKEVIVKK